MEQSLQPIINQLENLFETFNNKFFGGELERPVIAVNADGGASAFGWFTQWRSWKTDEDGHEGYYEINVTAEHLNRPIHEVCATLIHEMVHLHNQMNGIKDTSRGVTYHNKKFKETAEAHGLSIEHTEKYGWTKTSLTEATKDFIDSLAVPSFQLYRTGGKMAEKVGKAKQSSKKFVCPECGIIVRATKMVRVICAECDVELELEGVTDDET